MFSVLILIEKLKILIDSIPEFIWENIFTVLNTLICGLIVAIFTSTFLKKKEERTRIAGVILEKRINSEQNVLHFLESELFKEEINIENSSKYDKNVSEILAKYELPDPYHGRIQYARIFCTFDGFEAFFHRYEDQILTHRLWLDVKVRTHLTFIQMYFAVFNSIPLMVKRIPLPEGKELTDQEFEKVCNAVLLLLGASCDKEINGFLSELDELIVDSVYRLELKRPRKSMLRDNMYNVDMKSCQKKLDKTILGVKKTAIFQLIMDMVYEVKNIDFDNMSDEEYEEFLHSSDPEMYQELQNEFQLFKKSLETSAAKNGVKIVSKKDIHKYPGQYQISLGEILRGGDITEIKDIQ